LNNLPPTIVLDTSVVINILACGDAARMLKSLDRRVLVPRQVVDEIAREPIRHVDGANSLSGLLQSGLLQLHLLEGAHYLSFLDLVGAAAPDSLGDGEAATIAAAEQLQCMAIIDERKATRIARERRLPHLTGCTLDLYSCISLALAYSRDDLALLVFNSMQHARMRIPADRRAWVMELIGEERAKQCSCFPQPAATTTLERIQLHG
jgi:predicted nucleic acid-binding protein